MLNDLSYLGKSVPGVDGLIGLDVLKGRSFSIDFGRRKLYFCISWTLRFSTTMSKSRGRLFGGGSSNTAPAGAAPFGHGSERDFCL